MNMSSTLSLLLFLATIVSYGNFASPVSLTVYYESLCSFSMKFISNKLVPTYNDRNFNFTGLLANLTLVPYGHVTEINIAKYKYSCQHEQPECNGNKLHGCAIKYIEDMKILLNYISCLMDASVIPKKTHAPYPVNMCKDKVPNDLLEKIMNCYNTNEGWDVFNYYGRITNSFFGSSGFFIPYLSFNNSKDNGFSETSKKDFRKALCIKNDVRHEACTDNDSLKR